MCENFHLSFPVIFLFSRAIFRRHKNLNCWQKSFSRTMIQVYSEAYLRLSGRSGTSLGRARSAEPCLSQEVIQIYVPPKKADPFLLAPILFAWQRLCYLMFVTGLFSKLTNSQCLILNSDLEENCHSFAYNPQKDSVRLLKTSWLSQRDRKKLI